MASYKERMSSIKDQAMEVLNESMEQSGVSLTDLKDLDDEEVVLLRDALKLLDDCFDLYADMAGELDRLIRIESKLDLLLAKS